jgi:hypothetical protein
MEDSFGTILYIIITIVAIAISAVGKIKSKPKKPYVRPVERYETAGTGQTTVKEIMEPAPKPVFQTILETLSEEWKEEVEWEKTKSEVETQESEIDKVVPQPAGYEMYNKSIETDAELTVADNKLYSIEYAERNIKFQEDVLAEAAKYKAEPDFNYELMVEIRSSLQSKEEFRKAFILSEILNRPYN